MAEDTQNPKPQVEETKAPETSQENQKPENTNQGNRSTRKAKTISVYSNRILNLGKLHAKGKIIHFQPGVPQEVPYDELTQRVIDQHLEVGLLKRTKK